jgi:hypothetical protein
MKNIMDYFLTLILAAACVVAIGGLAYMIGDYARCSTRSAPVRRDNVRAVQVMRMPGVSCAPDGVAVTTETALRYAVTQLDVTLQRGRDVFGNRVTAADITHVADGVAREFPVPDVALAMLERCEPALLETHAHGYWLLSSAFVREAARQRAAQPAAGHAPRPARAGA